MNFKEQLERLGACVDALEWVGDDTFEQAWSTCDRGDWMLWLAGSIRLDMKLLTLAKCDCARLSLQFVPTGELRPLHAVETAERWARGEDSDEDLRTAAKAAYTTYYTAAKAAANVYAGVAANAAYTAANAAANAAYTAAAAAADAAAAANDARWSTLKTCADLVRARIPADAIAALLSEVALP